MEFLKTVCLFAATALAEIIGCYLPYLWLKQGKSVWLLVPAACSLALFVWLLAQHSESAGRVYAAYGAVYVGMAILWLWRIEKIVPSLSDLVGVAICLVGMAVIVLGSQMRS